ncbi:MAG: hypothetical protein OXR68_05360 [Alphaproteobacteria bacterium]|nr:hypothetical protein [Alphaproteobacteria bacterium]MDD9920031.1 hypothetical protein [Alphaproteobacteria bacterium]
MTKLFLVMGALVVAGCSAVTCEDPSLFEPIHHCGDECHWERD